MLFCEVCHRNSDDYQIQFCTKAGMYLCSKHKNQFLRNGEFKSDEKIVRYCAVCGRSSDETTVWLRRQLNQYLCAKHQAQYRKYGYFLEKTKRDMNDYEICGDYAKVFFRDTTTQEIKGYALIDAEDVDKCKKHKWMMTEMLGNTRYVRAIIDGVNTSIHRFVLDYHGDLMVDHINRNGLDNRKCNLRIVTPSENCTNTVSRSATGFKNIYYKNDKFSLQITRDGAKYHLGTFEKIEDAIHARDSFIEQYNSEHNRVV